MTNIADRCFCCIQATWPMVALAFVVALPISTPVSRGLGAEEDAQKPADGQALAPGSPEGVLLEFIVAVAACNSERIERVSVPHPDAIVLSQGQPAPPEAQAIMRKTLPNTFSRLKVGDQVKLPNGDAVVVDETHVNEDRIEINAAGAPVPFILARYEGAWKVEPDPLIHARLAARRALNRDSEDEWPEWSPAEKDLDQLGKEAQQGRIRIRAPRDHVLSPGGAPALLWQGPVRNDKTQGNLIVTVIKLTPDLTKLSLDQLLRSALSGIARRRDRWRLGIIEHGVIAGRRFARARWTGVSKPSTREEYSARAMRGFVYGTIAEGEFVFIMSQDVAAHARDALPVAEASVLTARIEEPSEEEAKGR